MVHWCTPPPALTQLHAREPAVTFWQMFLQCNMGFAATQAKQVLLPEPKDCSHGEEKEEEQSQEAPESWISCSSLFSPSLSSLCPSQTAEPRASCSPLWVQPHTWLVSGAGLGHSQHCFEPIYSHFRGESSLKPSRAFL